MTKKRGTQKRESIRKSGVYSSLYTGFAENTRTSCTPFRTLPDISAAEVVSPFSRMAGCILCESKAAA